MSARRGSDAAHEEHPALPSRASRRWSGFDGSSIYDFDDEGRTRGDAHLDLARQPFQGDSVWEPAKAGLRRHELVRMEACGARAVLKPSG